MPRTVSSPGPKSHGFWGRRGFQEARVPIGVQLIGRPFEVALLLRAARTFERELDFWHEKPRLSV